MKSPVTRIPCLGCGVQTVVMPDVTETVCGRCQSAAAHLERIRTHAARMQLVEQAAAKRGLSVNSQAHEVDQAVLEAVSQC